jgi:hypothetical protein
VLVCLSVCMHVCAYTHMYALQMFLKRMWISYSWTAGSVEVFAALCVDSLWWLCTLSTSITGIRDWANSQQLQCKGHCFTAIECHIEIVSCNCIESMIFIIDIFFYHFVDKIILLLGHINSLNPWICLWSQTCHSKYRFLIRSSYTIGNCFISSQKQTFTVQQYIYVVF